MVQKIKLKTTTDKNNTNPTATTAASSSGTKTSSLNTKYIKKFDSVFSSTGDAKKNITNLFSSVKERNAADTEKIHGMSEEEYDEYQAYARDTYGIQLENLSVGNFQSVAVSMERMIGKETTDAMAASYDSVLDLVLDQKLNNALEDIFGKDCKMPDWDSIMNCANRLKKEYGIVIEQNADRMFWVSLVDENGNVIKDENGNLAQVKKTDHMLPDGLAQKNEIFASGALDMMGYDCVSFLDLSAEEYDQVKAMAQMKNSDIGDSSGKKSRQAWTEFMENKNYKKHDCSEWIENDRDAYWDNFEAQKKSRYFDDRVNKYTGQTMDYYDYHHLEGTARPGSPGDPFNSEADDTAGDTAGVISGKSKTSEEAQAAKNSNKVAITQSQYNDKVKKLVQEGKTETSAKEAVDEKFYIEGQKTASA